MFHSVNNEERNLLRLQAWEQRNQETSQAKELNPQNVPLFGEPYKVSRVTYCSASVAPGLIDSDSFGPFVCNHVVLPLAALLL